MSSVATTVFAPNPFIYQQNSPLSTITRSRTSLGDSLVHFGKSFPRFSVEMRVNFPTWQGVAARSDVSSKLERQSRYAMEVWQLRRVLRIPVAYDKFNLNLSQIIKSFEKTQQFYILNIIWKKPFLPSIFFSVTVQETIF